MQATAVPDDRALELELIVAALRYVAVADWFESRPVSARERQRDNDAMDLFNGVESVLRQAGGRLLRRRGSRQPVLQNVLAEAFA